jgi:hypothetical protein
MCSSVAPAAATHLPQRFIDEIDVREPFGFVEIDDQMHAGATHAVADDEVILAIVDDR